MRIRGKRQPDKLESREHNSGRQRIQNMSEKIGELNWKGSQKIREENGQKKGREKKLASWENKSNGVGKAIGKFGKDVRSWKVSNIG